MKTLYIDCGRGAAGDMLAAALLELLPDPAAFVSDLNALGIPGVTVSLERVQKCGITGSHFRVEVNRQEETPDRIPHGHSHSSMAHIEDQVFSLSLPTMVKLEVLAVYQLLAQAESKVHGVPVSDIHFHEVGTMDALVDITAVCWLMYRLKPDRIAASAVHVGGGTVRCAHGVLPVPAPATALLLEGIPTYGGSIPSELCTPTGAALLRHFVTAYGPQPVLTVERIGYGMGKKDFERANCLRCLLGEEPSGTSDTVLELKCNIDDMTGEALGFALEALLAAGALDAYTVPIGMKKSRPGVQLCVLCREGQREQMTGLLFRHTTTLGVREALCRRAVLTRREAVISTPYGPVGKKISAGFGVRREKYEYEDLARIAREQGKNLDWARAVCQEAEKHSSANQ